MTKCPTPGALSSCENDLQAGKGKITLLCQNQSPRLLRRWVWSTTELEEVPILSPDQGQGERRSSACSGAVIHLSQTLSNVREPQRVGWEKEPFGFCRLRTYSCEGSPNKIVMLASNHTACVPWK